MSVLADDFQALLTAALSMNDALCIEVDHASFTGSMNQAEDFRQLVNQLWHKHNLKPDPQPKKFETGPGGLWKDERGYWREPGEGIRGGGR